MRIEPITELPFATFSTYHRKWSEARTPMGISGDDIRSLLPLPEKKASSIWDLIPRITPKRGQFSIVDILGKQLELATMVFTFQTNRGGDVDSGDDYERYLQVPNARIKALARSIVEPRDSDDEKMFKVEQWVKENITYVSDIQNYGQMEYWSYPTVTLNRGKGDCEDGAFLIHSLALHAGVAMDKLRTYGGFVQESEGSPLLGGHAWTAYRRDSDNSWVELDWCYYPTDKPLADRVAMKDDMKYVDDFFYVDGVKTVDASLTNRIRRPMGGSVVNLYA